ncbi:hypothetical protein SynNOUM97013_02653 [Synechococcus sp. NOUM97013]|nr:hypothetical protein SynNOUM97013_02653 [Synechococcus sp. NOUM97013]
MTSIRQVLGAGQTCQTGSRDGNAHGFSLQVENNLKRRTLLFAS